MRSSHRSELQETERSRKVSGRPFGEILPRLVGLTIFGVLVNACGSSAQSAKPAATPITITLRASPAITIATLPIGSRVETTDATSLTSPYVVNPIVVAPVGADRSIECGTHVTVDHIIEGSPSAATPAGALDTFLQSDDGEQANKPNPVQPFREYHISDGSVRFEHFVAWTQHVSVAVRPTASERWTVVSWSDTVC